MVEVSRRRVCHPDNEAPKQGDQTTVENMRELYFRENANSESIIYNLVYTGVPTKRRTYVTLFTFTNSFSPNKNTKNNNKNF